MLLLVHSNGDSGWPRVAGSTKAVKACRRPGSVLVNALRPPPGRRIPEAQDADPWAGRDSSSALPAATVLRANPVAIATVLTPPHPTATASAPAHRRRIRSSIPGNSNRYLWRIRSTMVVSIHYPSSESQERQHYFAQVICSRLLTTDSNRSRANRGFLANNKDSGVAAVRVRRFWPAVSSFLNRNRRFSCP